MKEIKRIAKKIIALEKELKLGKNVKSNEQKIEEIMKSLSLEEMLELDQIICQKEKIF